MSEPHSDSDMSFRPLKRSAGRSNTFDTSVALAIPAFQDTYSALAAVYSGYCDAVCASQRQDCQAVWPSLGVLDQNLHEA